jgi:hypothetical protein
MELDRTRIGVSLMAIVTCVIFRFQKISKDFKRFQGISRDFKRFQGISKDFKGFQKTSRDFKRFQEISRDFKGFQKISRDFRRFQKILAFKICCFPLGFLCVSCRFLLVSDGIQVSSLVNPVTGSARRGTVPVRLFNGQGYCRHVLPMSNNTARKRPVPRHTGDFMEAVFPPEIFLMISDRLLPESSGNWLESTGKNPENFWSEYCFHFRRFPVLSCRIRWP